MKYLARALARATMASALLLAAIAGLGANPPAHASQLSAAVVQAERYGGSAAGNAALDWAEAHAAGCRYVYGGAGPCPDGYDCSGLISAAFAHADGIGLPHSTWMIPGNRHVHRIPLADAQRGDILAYGPGHMELDTAWPGTSFGAHDSGTRTGWIRWNRYWAPTAAYRVS